MWGQCSFLLGPGAHKVLFVPSKSLSPQSCGNSGIKPHWPLKSIPWGFSVPLPDPQVGTSVVCHGMFVTERELLWYNCSAVCGSSAQWLRDGDDGSLLHEGLGHTPRLPGLLQAEPPCPRWPLPSPHLCRRRSDTHRRSGSASVGSRDPVCTRFCLSPPSISGGYGVSF